MTPASGGASRPASRPRSWVTRSMPGWATATSARCRCGSGAPLPDDARDIEGLPVEPCNVADYERLAREALSEGAYGYFAGGAGDERTLRENVEAYGRWRLRPRALVDVSEASTATSVLGANVSMPLLVAPVA